MNINQEKNQELKTQYFIYGFGTAAISIFVWLLVIQLIF
jgi:hypothetical protein